MYHNQKHHLRIPQILQGFGELGRHKVPKQMSAQNASSKWWWLWKPSFVQNIIATSSIVILPYFLWHEQAYGLCLDFSSPPPYCRHHRILLRLWNNKGNVLENQEESNMSTERMAVSLCRINNPTQCTGQGVVKALGPRGLTVLPTKDCFQFHCNLPTRHVQG